MARVSKAQAARIETRISEARDALIVNGVDPGAATADQAINAVPAYEADITANERKIFGTAWRQAQTEDSGQPLGESAAIAATSSITRDARVSAAMAVEQEEQPSTNGLPANVTRSKSGGVKIKSDALFKNRWMQECKGDNAAHGILSRSAASVIEVADADELQVLDASARGCRETILLAGEAADKERKSFV